MVDLDYQLTLNNVVIKNSEKADFTVGNYKTSVTLYGVSMDRKLYQPGHIQAEILMATGKVTNTFKLETLTNALIGATASLNVCMSIPGGIRKWEVATDYYVHEITPQFELVSKTEESVGTIGGGGMPFKVTKYEYDIYIKLDIFSPEKKMTLEKYSHVYLGQRLFSEIVTNQISSFGTISTETGKLQHTQFKIDVLTANGSGTESKELIHPYLVQYNESFYDFISRVANRIGEIFYYEGGKLHFGLPDKDATEITNARSILFERMAGSPITNVDYARDAVKEHPVTGTTYAIKGDDAILSDPVSKDASGYPDDAFSDSAFPYNSELASDDHYMLLYKDRFARDSYGDLFWGNTDEHLMVWLSDILNSTSIVELLSKAGGKLLKNLAQSGIKCGDKTEKGNDKLKKASMDSKRDYNYAVLFSKVDNNDSHWVTLNYYRDIRVKAEQQMRKGVCVDMGEGFANVGIGDKITIPYDDATYVVTRVEMSSSVPWKRSYDSYSGGPTPQAAQSQRIYAVPIFETEDSSLFYPPILPGNPFRQSGPQPAFVSDASDPTNQGRVRIRFAWQPADCLKTYKDAITTALNELKKYADIDSYGIPTKKKDAKENDYLKALNAYKGKRDELTTAKADLGDDASPWIRMATPLATLEGGGMFFRPEVGDEVMVDFENGNVDHPYVVGALFSKETRTPKKIDRGIVSRNGHTIRFDDTGDVTEFIGGLLPGVKMLKSYIPNLEADVTGDSRKILGGIELTDKYGFYNVKLSSSNRNISIASPFGDINVNAFTGISINAPNGDIKISGKNVDISAYNKVTITSGKNVKQKSYNHTRTGYFGTFLDPKEWGKAMGSVANDLVGKLFDFSLIRSLLEIFIRPVDGTLKLKSQRMLQIEAGDGGTVAAPNSYNFKLRDDKIKMDSGSVLIGLVSAISGKVDQFVSDFVQYYKDFRKASEHVQTNVRSGKIATPNNWDDVAKLVFNEHAWVNEKDFQTVREAFVNYQTNDKKVRFDNNRSVYAESHVIALLKSAMQLRKCVEKDLDEMFVNDKLKKSLRGVFTNADAKAILDLAQAAPAAGSNELRDKINEVTEFIAQHVPARAFAADLNEADYADWKKFMKRRLIIMAIEKCRANKALLGDCAVADAPVNGNVTTIDEAGVLFTPASPANTPALDDASWTAYVNGVRLLKSEKERSGAGKFAEGFLDSGVNGFLDKLIPFENDVWKGDTPGKILISDGNNKTFRLNDTGWEYYINPVRTLMADEAELKRLMKAI